MTDTTLLPCPMCRAQLLFWTDTGCGDGYEHPDNDCYLSKAIVQPDRYAAWNRRDQWRPKSEWRFKGENGRFVFYYPKQRAEWFDGVQLGPMYEHGCEPPDRAMDWTLFMEITPPAPVSGGK